MAVYVTTADVDALIGSDVRKALFSDTDDPADYSSTFFDAQVLMASAVIRSAALNSGYETGATTTSDIVKLAALGQLLMMAYGRKSQAIPDQFATAINLAEGIRSGQIPIPDLTPTARDAVGGNSFTESDPTIEGSRPQVFGNLRNLR